MPSNIHPNAYVNPYATLFTEVQSPEAARMLNRMLRTPGGRGRVVLQRTSPVAEGAARTQRPMNRAQANADRPAVKLPVDAWQSNEAYVITAYVPGVDINDIEITFEDDELLISGRFPRRANKLQALEAEAANGAGEGTANESTADESTGEEASDVAEITDSNKIELVRSELFHGKFERRLTFRQAVNADAIEATCSNGVLTLTVPKAEVVKPRQIRVTAK
jgi:HSP20 family protein